MSTLYDKLKIYSESDYYGFHMPGHKRKAMGNLPYEIDITEIEGFDDLHHAEGILLDAQKRAARLYCADETHFLVNGSTVGILSAICGVTEKGDTILVARNCHKSVYHAIYLNELHPIYLYPHFDSEVCLNEEIDAKDVIDALEHHPDIRAVVIVSPTYDGVVSDVAAIADAVHRRGLPLIVDEAHGAHFGFHNAFPKNANVKGADIVIHSVHKTLPSLTQTALLHMNGQIVNRIKVRKYLDMLQTSSPSYVLMASIDACMEWLEKAGAADFERYTGMLYEMRRQLLGLKHLELVRQVHYDDSKLVISVRRSDITSRELNRMLLDSYHLQMEMVAGTYVLAMTSVADTKEGLNRLTNALFEIDNKIGYGKMQKIPGRGRQPHLEVVLSIAQAEAAMQQETGKESESLLWECAVGHVSLEYAYLYPPGSPLIVPGERITEEVVHLLEWYQKNGFSIEGLKRENYIEVLINE